MTPEPPKPILRPSRTLPSGTKGPPVDPDEAEKLAALADVVQAATAFEQAVAAAKPMESWRSRPIVLAAIAIPCLAIFLYSQFAQPEWVYGPDAGKVAPAERDAHLRFAMYLVAQRLDAHRAQTGAVPETLLEIGEDWRDIHYSVLSRSEYELRAAPDSSKALVFHSGDDPVAFLGSSRQQLRRGTP